MKEIKEMPDDAEPISESIGYVIQGMPNGSNEYIEISGIIGSLDELQKSFDYIKNNLQGIHYSDVRCVVIHEARYVVEMG